MSQCNNIISYGQYVIIQRKDYKKLHLLSEKNSIVFIGKDKVELDVVIGNKSGSVFKMFPKIGCNRHFTLKMCSLSDILSALKPYKDVGSGQDNRSICDDGSSQSLTSNCIEELRDVGTSPKGIIEQLVENSKTYQIKTEFSQEKYIKKKEKKYFEFISICSPTLRLLAEILYSRDLPKCIGIRIDTLSQLVTMLNFQPDGSYILLENGFNGIVAATLLNSLSDRGRIVHITPGNSNQKQAVLAMNFSKCHIERLLTIRLSTLSDFIRSQRNLPMINNECLGLLDNHDKDEDVLNDNQIVSKCVDYTKSNGSKSNTPPEVDNESPTSKSSDNVAISHVLKSNLELRKRKYSDIEKSDDVEGGLKKPRWALEAELATTILMKKVDGIMIACKEYPLNIVNTLLEYLLPSRPIVVYSLYNEPLVALYLQLKRRHDVVCLKITETWLRPYQVLPERSHPAVTISATSGYLLTGLKVNK